MRLQPAVLAALLAFAATPAPGTAQQRLHDADGPRPDLRGSLPLPAGTRVQRDLAYGPHPQQRYDVYLPRRTMSRAPILLMVHGGGWRRGDKDNPGVVANKAAYWLAKGFVFVSVGYRLLPDADPSVQASDVAAATADVQRHAAGWHADPRKLVLMGHSAGAHLVDLLGADPSRLMQPGTRRPLGVVSLDSGALDVPALMRRPGLPPLYRDAFGDDPDYWRSVSPRQQLQDDGLPMLLVCSGQRRFPTSPCDEARNLARRGRALGVPVQVLPVALTHGRINSDLGLPSDYTRQVSDWVDRRLH